MAARKKESFASEQKEALFCWLEDQEAGGSFFGKQLGIMGKFSLSE